MGTEDERRRDPGDAVREGVRSMIGILGALKDAIEDTFEELRTGGEATPDDARSAAKSTFQAAQEAVEDVRERLDFITRREFDALRAQVDELTARVNALSSNAAATPHEPQQPPAAPGEATATGTHTAAESDIPPVADPRPADRPSQKDSDYRFEIE